jgi:hypothetical protein
MEVSIRTWLYEKLAASDCERDRHALIALLRLGESRANDRGVADRLTNAEQLVCAALRAHPSHTTRALTEHGAQPNFREHAKTRRVAARGARCRGRAGELPVRVVRVVIAPGVCIASAAAILVACSSTVRGESHENFFCSIRLGTPPSDGPFACTRVARGWLGRADRDPHLRVVVHALDGGVTP